MSLPTNILQQVQTYQMSALRLFQNNNCFVSTANTAYKNFEKFPANLGDTVTFDYQPQATVVNSLVASFQGAKQNVASLTVNQQLSASFDFTDQQFIFNVKDYIKKFAGAAVVELAANCEAQVASVCEQVPFRFYGNGVTAINSFQQLAAALAMFRNFSQPPNDTKVYLQDTAVPAIVGSGLNQFAPTRNNELANSWEVGRFSRADFYYSNLLPLHYAGSMGNAGTTLTVTGTNDPTGANITQITFSGAGTDASAIKAYDRLQFQDNVSGQPNVRYLTWVGHKVSANPVQCLVTADAPSSGGNVTVNLSRALCSQAGNVNQNINHNIVAGMQIKLLPDHRCGLITSDKAMFIAMPQLPTQSPYDTANHIDPDTGVSIRATYGSLFGQNQRGFIYDLIYGYTLVDINAMTLIFPANS